MKFITRFVSRGIVSLGHRSTTLDNARQRSTPADAAGSARFLGSIADYAARRGVTLPRANNYRDRPRVGYRSRNRGCTNKNEKRRTEGGERETLAMFYQLTAVSLKLAGE